MMDGMACARRPSATEGYLVLEGMSASTGTVEAPGAHAGDDRAAVAPGERDGRPTAMRIDLKQKTARLFTPEQIQQTLTLNGDSLPPDTVK
jgi:hypothetical protein